MKTLFAGQDLEEENDKNADKVDTVQKKMLAVSGQDVDAYMKEMEEVHKKTEKAAADIRSRMAGQPLPPGEIPTQSFVQMAPAPGMFKSFEFLANVLILSLVFVRAKTLSLNGKLKVIKSHILFTA